MTRGYCRYCKMFRRLVRGICHDCTVEYVQDWEMDSRHVYPIGRTR